MKLKPQGDRIIVKPKDDDEATTASGLVIPDTAKEKPQLGDVLAVGPGDFQDGERIPLDVKGRGRRLLLEVRRYGNQVRGRGLLDPVCP